MPIAFLARQPDQTPEYPVTLDPELVAAMNQWRLAQSPVQSPHEAIISLIRIGLDSAAVTVRPASNDRNVALEDLENQFKAILSRSA